MSPLFRASVLVFILRLGGTSRPKAKGKVSTDGSMTSRRRCATTDASRFIPPNTVTATGRATTSTYASADFPSVSVEKVTSQIVNEIKLAN